jgi:hypothetical protein
MKGQKKTRIATDKISQTTFGGCKKRQFHNIIVGQLEEVSLCRMLRNTECNGEVC